MCVRLVSAGQVEVHIQRLMLKRVIIASSTCTCHKRQMGFKPGFWCCLTSYIASNATTARVCWCSHRACSHFRATQEVMFLFYIVPNTTTLACAIIFNIALSVSEIFSFKTRRRHWDVRPSFVSTWAFSPGGSTHCRATLRDYIDTLSAWEGNELPSISQQVLNLEPELTK